jgi:acetyl/propionyl-CoA carboxylase alpha subunit/acetyl-CoA carboxylase carboxyltransferase component
MSISRLLIANRGEIAIRIARAAHDLGIEAVAVYPEDDSQSLHLRIADEAAPLSGAGVSAYLDIEGLLEVARRMGCDAVHPGYGFLAESGTFANRCAESNITFVGPRPELLELFGDKGRARVAAAKSGVPIIRGTDKSTSIREAESFFDSIESGVMMIKAIAGGGGRGTRIVQDSSAIAESYERCHSEALAAFGNGDLYVEELMERARHIEVQIVGDGNDVIQLGERECSVQRRHQKIVEVAPAPNLPNALRQQICESAVSFASDVKYENLGTFEFLVEAVEEPKSFVFLEVNARLQVEHTVTEEVTGIDLVQTQLRIAGGESLTDIGLEQHTSGSTIGYAVQARVNMETMTPDGDVRPSGGTITAYDVPSGPGVRTDGFGYANYTTSPNYDSLLAKVIGHSRSTNFEDAVKRTCRALSEFRLEGIRTNIPFLQTVLKHPEFVSGKVYTRWVDDLANELAASNNGEHPRRFHEPVVHETASNAGLAGAQLASTDPLALFDHDRSTKQTQSATAPETPLAPDGSVGVLAPMQGTIVSVFVSEGDTVHEGQDVVIVAAMKLEHHVVASASGIVQRITVAQGDVVQEGHALVFIEERDVGDNNQRVTDEIELDEIRSDLQESIDRHAYGLDENRPDALEKRRKTGQRTARENILDLCDEGTFHEYGALVVAAQRRRRTMDWLRSKSPADGLICGMGTVNGDLFPDSEARVMAISYDYTVLAGTQGAKNHYKKDRMFDLAHRYRLPVVLYTEGGGGRPGDVDKTGGVGMDVTTFTQWSKLSGLVPLVGINSGRCFAGNTALLGCADVVIATENSTIGMGGPAMIEGGQLGVFTPEEIGPMSVQVPNGVVDILVKDEAEATQVAKKYLSYFQGTVKDWEEHDQRLMRHIIPENRIKTYDIRDVIETLADKDSVLEIRKNFGIGIITALVRIEGKPLGLIANNPHHLAGAIDSDGADKGARFLQLCDAFDLPVITLMDCPGIMVGPEVEKTALVRHCCRMFNTTANLTVPMFALVVRKAYGLGAQAMCGAGSLVPFFTAAWPTAEFAGMNIEGAVKLGFRNDLAAIEDPEERLQKYNEMVADSYDKAKAVNAASFFGIDDVIDPAASRDWIVMGLRSLPPMKPRTEKKRSNIDTW